MHSLQTPYAVLRDAAFKRNSQGRFQEEPWNDFLRHLEKFQNRERGLLKIERRKHPARTYAEMLPKIHRLMARDGLFKPNVEDYIKRLIP